MKHTLIFAIIIMLLLCFSGCKELEKILDSNLPITATPTVAPSPTLVPTLIPTSVPTSVPTAVSVQTPAGPNPVCGTKQHPSKAHLLWKPVSDTTGKAVIVFDGKYKELFKSVKIQLKTGATENAYWTDWEGTGLAPWGNPDSVGLRQHWRLRNNCAIYNDNAVITAVDSKQTCTFKLQGTSCNRIE